MVNNLFGQYLYKDSLIHRLEPRIKLILVISISSFLFFLNSYFQFFLTSGFVAFLIALSKIKIGNVIKNLKPFLFFFIFILLMYYLFSRSDFYRGIIVVWRFILLIVISSILTFTTSITQLVYAIEKLLKPLRIFKISPRDIALMVSTAIRFVPLLFYEANNVRDAQISRGAKFRKIKHISQFVISMLNKTFRKANSLADAIESRCYRNHSYSHFRE